MTGNKRHAVITGIGVVTPIGSTNSTYWDSLLHKKNGIKRVELFDVGKYPMQLAGEITDFNVYDYLEKNLVLQTDRWTWLAMAATQLAFQDANLNPEYIDSYKMGVITASSLGGNDLGQIESQNLYKTGVATVGPYRSTAWFYAANSGQISIKYNMKGPSCVLTAEGAGGLDAFYYSQRVIKRGTDVVVTGGAEAPINPLAWVCQIKNNLMSKNKDPVTAFSPFDFSASGYVPGEGSAILLVEELEHAKLRNAPHIYGEIIGYAATFDAYHHSDQEPNGIQLSRAISLALNNAKVGLDEVDVIFADAAGIPLSDAAEVKAIKQVFGQFCPIPPITAPKSMVGRLYSGGGPLDVATALLAMQNNCIPPTINLENPIENLRFVTRPEPAEINIALICARGFGGFNSAVVIKKYEK